MVNKIKNKITLGSYTLLQSLPGLEGCTGDKCEVTGLSQYLGWLYKFALAAAAFLAVLMIVIGGIQMIVGGASETARSDGKKRIEQAIWGLLLAITAWLVLYSINPDLVKTGLTIPGITIEAPAEVAVTGEGGSNLSSDQVKTELEKYIGFNNIKEGVNLAGLQQSTIDGMGNLQNDCNGGLLSTKPKCKIFITSATEGQHATGDAGKPTHANGYKVDIRLDQNLDSYIKTNFKNGVKNDSKEFYYDKNNNQYVYEKKCPSSADCTRWAPHWDVTYLQ